MVMEQIPCDAILIKGDAIVDEGMLTGETTPVIKGSTYIDSATKHSLKRLFKNSKYSLYAGTKLLRVSPEPTIAIVFKTGFQTQKGFLIQSILFPKPDTFQFHKDSMLFIGILAIIGTCDF